MGKISQSIVLGAALTFCCGAQMGCTQPTIQERDTDRLEEIDEELDDELSKDTPNKDVIKKLTAEIKEIRKRALVELNTH